MHVRVMRDPFSPYPGELHESWVLIIMEQAPLSPVAKNNLGTENIWCEDFHRFHPERYKTLFYGI